MCLEEVADGAVGGGGGFAAVGVSMRQPRAKKAADSPLAGKTIVVTGRLENLSRKEIQDTIKHLGGRTTGSVSHKTDFVIAGERAGAKLAKAQELGVDVLNEREFLKLIGR